MKKIYFNPQYSMHYPEWRWSGEHEDMVCRCTCGGPLDCDRNQAINAWKDHIHEISKFISDGSASLLAGKDPKEVEDSLFELISLVHDYDEVDDD